MNYLFYKKVKDLLDDLEKNPDKYKEHDHHIKDLFEKYSEKEKINMTELDIKHLFEDVLCILKELRILIDPFKEPRAYQRIQEKELYIKAYLERFKEGE